MKVVFLVSMSKEFSFSEKNKDIFLRNTISFLDFLLKEKNLIILYETTLITNIEKVYLKSDTLKRFLNNNKSNMQHVEPHKKENCFFSFSSEKCEITETAYFHIFRSYAVGVKSASEKE